MPSKGLCKHPISGHLLPPASSVPHVMCCICPQEMADVEIDVMNQLNHRNLIQLYDAIETPREIMLFME